MPVQRKQKKVKPETKVCPKCGRALPLARFYPNRDWADQVFKDVWCKDCALRVSQNEEGLKLYCYENNREWSQALYDTAAKKAQVMLSTNAEYNSVNATPEDRQHLTQNMIAKAFFTIMNLTQYYRFVDNDVTYVTTVPDPSLIPKEDKEPKQMEYNKRWRGYFTPEQIEILEETYAQYDKDFDLSDASLQDYAMKVAKASFHADQMYDLMRRGEATLSDYKDAQKIFDDLSKSSNFAACRRKPGETTGMGSLGEIILRIEGMGKLNVDGDVWPKDSVDMAIAEFRHTLIAAGRDGEI